jgi:hypothetical protein
MAIAFVRNSGQVTATAPLGGGSVSIPITAGAVGNTLVVFVTVPAATGAGGCSDSSGTTYTLDKEVKNGIAVVVMAFSAAITTAGVTSISVNSLGASAVVSASAIELSGVVPASRVDTSGSGSGIGTAVSAGPTAGNLLENDAWVAAFGSTGSLGTFTAGGSATAITGADQTGGSLGGEYFLTPTAGATATGTGTFSTTGTWAGLIVAYKAAPVPATVALNPGAGSSGGTLAVTAPTKTTLSSAGAVSGASLALSAPAKLTVEAGASSGASLAVTAPTRIALQPAAGKSEAGGPAPEPSEELFPSEELYPGQGDLPLTAPSLLALSAGGVSGASLATTAPARIPITGGGQSGASLGATVPTEIPLEASGAVSGAELQPTAPPQLPTLTASGQSTASLGVVVQAGVPLEASAATSTGSLTVKTTAPVPLNPAGAVSGGELFLNAHLALLPAQAQSGASLAARAPTGAGLNPAEGQAGGSLTSTAPTRLPLTPAAGSSTGTLRLASPFSVHLNPAHATSEAGGPAPEPGEELYPEETLYPGQGNLPIRVAERPVLFAANATSSASLQIKVTRLLTHPGRTQPRELAGVVAPSTKGGRV